MNGDGTVKGWLCRGVLWLCGCGLVMLTGCAGGHGQIVFRPPPPAATGGTVTGRVVTATDTAIAGAAVATDRGQAAATGGNGRFQLAGVPAGQVVVTATAAGFNPNSVTASVGEGQTLDVGDITLAPTAGAGPPPPPPPPGGGPGNPPPPPFP